MKLVFNRTYVTQGNIGYIKGMDVPESFDGELIERLLNDGIVKVVESPQAFIEKVTKKSKAKAPEAEVEVENEVDEVEALNPERKPRSK